MKKILFRILFVLIAAAVITFMTILLGNYLLYKVSELDAARDHSEETTALPTEFSSGEPENERYDSPAVFGAAIRLDDYSSEDEVILAINTLAASYDTLLLPVTDADGKLLYQSPALCTLTRMPEPEDNPEFRLLCSAAAAAKAQNMRLCAVLTPNSEAASLDEAAQLDAAIIDELALYGIDEVMITLSDDAIKMGTEEAETLQKYIDTCFTRSDGVCPIGILLSSELYLDASSAMPIQQIASAASFLAIKFPVSENAAAADAYNYVSDSITSLLGSFNVYNLRVILDGSAEILSGKYKACQDGGITNVCFTSAVLPVDLEYRAQTTEESTETDQPAESEDPSGHTNPYASGSAAGTEEAVEGDTTPASENSEGGMPWY